MEKNLEFIGEQLKKLTAIPSPSSYTEKAAEYLMETLKEMGYEPELSNKGFFVRYTKMSLLRLMI